MDVIEIYKKFILYPVITTDTRNIIPDSIFFALKGDHFDGNTFAEYAVNQGCRYAVIDNPKFALGEQYILVEDVLVMLQKLANYHRKQLTIPIIAITGTNGKTTTKELINTVLQTKYHTNATKGNLNNHIGVPLTLLSIQKDNEIAIVEMGANHPGEIQFLCQIAEPDYGIITNIGKAHLEGFGGYEGVIKTKKELYDYIRIFGKQVFVNQDNQLLNNLSADIPRFTYSTKPSLDIELTENNPFLCFRYKKLIVNTQISGIYNIENIIAAIEIGRFFSIPEKDAVLAIENYQPSNNRSQLYQGALNKIILDAYNANPSSMDAAIQNFVSLKDANKLLIIGDMFELGNDSLFEHKQIIQKIKNNNLKAFVIGTQYAQAYEGEKDVMSFADCENFISYIKTNPIKDKLVLLKGSRGMKLEALLKYL